MKFARVREREKTYAIKNWQQPKKKDIKLKVVKASFKIFNLFPISFLSFSWVFSRILTTKQSAIDSHFKCVWWSCFSYTQLPPSSPLKTSSVVIFFCSSKGREYERVKKERRKTNKIIYCLSICVIFFDYNSHISIIFFHHPILSSYAFSLFYRIFFYRNEPINVSWLRDFSLSWLSLCLQFSSKAIEKISNEKRKVSTLWKKILHIDQLWMMAPAPKSHSRFDVVESTSHLFLRSHLTFLI